MTPEYIDIHSHINFPQYDADREDVIAKLKQDDIWTITIGTDLQTSQQAVRLANTHENLFATIGLHPSDTDQSFRESGFELLIDNPKVVAIGECGLDYATTSTDKRDQKDQFEKQIDFAIKFKKPLMIHCRQAYPDALDILSSKKREYGDKLKANFHFFTENTETAQKILNLGFTVSFTGVITFVSQYEEIVSYVPLESMMSETDAPFVAPMPHRGKRNEPGYVTHIVEKIAQIKGKSLFEVKEQLVKNAIAAYGLK